MMKRILIVGIVLCLGLTGLYAAPGKRDMPKKLVEELQLSADQAAQFQAAHERERKQSREKFSEIRKLHQALDNEFLKEKPDETKIAASMDQIKQKQIELTDIRFQLLLETRKILTPEQMKKMISLRQEFEKKSKASFKKEFKDRKKTDDMPPPPPDGMMP